MDTIPSTYAIVGNGDYDGDGKADILWRHTPSGQVWMWLMNGTTRQSETLVDTVDVVNLIVASGDFDAGGKADILWRHATTGDVSLWLMNGTTPLSKTVVATMSTDVTLSIYRMQ